MSTTYACYTALLNDQLYWFSQSYGNARAIGFRPRPECRDFRAALQRVQTLFANYDPRPKGAWGEFPAAPRLCRQHDVIYISMDDERLHATLVNYFESNLPRELGQIVKGLDSEGDETSDFVYDTAEVSRLARELAARWMSEQIEVKCFLMDEPVVSHPEYAVGLSRYQPSPVCS